MIFRLSKMSSPGWEKDFLTETEAGLYLKSWICRGCRGVDEHGNISKPGDDPEADDFGCAHGSENVYDLLNTPCGCEFYLEEIPDANDY